MMVMTTQDVAPATAKRLSDALTEIAGRLDRSRAGGRGDIVVHVSGATTGTYRLAHDGQQVRVEEGPSAASASTTPRLEVIADAQALQSILDGTVDAREQFLAGGLRVRGDLRYLSDIGLELGLLKHAL
jgi:hypothetical protein